MEHVHTVNMRIALLVLLIIAGILNILGIYLIYQLKSKLKEHGLLLCFFSGTTIVVTLLESIYWIGEMVGLEEYSSRLWQAIIIIDLGVFCAYYLSLLVLTLDRLFAVICLQKVIEYQKDIFWNGCLLHFKYFIKHPIFLSRLQ